MAAEVLERATPQKTGGPRGPARPGEPGGGDGRDGEGSSGLLGDPARFGLIAFLGTVSMLFIGFTSAFILRRASGDYRPLSPPPILSLNTAVRLASSAALERARRGLRRFDLRAAQAWVAVAGCLGLSFLLGQVEGWRQLRARGVFLATNPSSSFFYLLTGLHGLHLLGGLFWFAVILVQLRKMTLTPGEDGLRLLATYWHFLGALWLYLLFLLFVY
jgi:cytochrome c oxidase subunit 3